MIERINGVKKEQKQGMFGQIKTKCSAYISNKDNSYMKKTTDTQVNLKLKPWTIENISHT